MISGEISPMTEEQFTDLKKLIKEGCRERECPLCVWRKGGSKRCQVFQWGDKNGYHNRGMTFLAKEKLKAYTKEIISTTSSEGGSR